MQVGKDANAPATSSLSPHNELHYSPSLAYVYELQSISPYRAAWNTRLLHHSMTVIMIPCLYTSSLSPWCAPYSLMHAYMQKFGQVKTGLKSNYLGWTCSHELYSVTYTARFRARAVCLSRHGPETDARATTSWKKWVVRFAVKSSAVYLLREYGEKSFCKNVLKCWYTKPQFECHAVFIPSETGKNFLFVESARPDIPIFRVKSKWLKVYTRAVKKCNALGNVS